MIQLDFLKACREGNITRLIRMIDNNLIDFDFLSEDGFRTACINGQLDVVKLFIEKKPTINVSNYNEHALRSACSFGHFHVMKWLVENFPTIDVHIRGDECFSIACNRGHHDIVEWMIETYPEIDINHHHLVLASKNGHLDVVKLLLTKNPDMNANSAFLKACINLKCDTFIYLYTVSKNKEELMEMISPLQDSSPYYKVARLVLIKRIIAAKRIKRAWLKCYYSPYTKIGIKRLNREYDGLVEEGIISS